MPATKCRVCEGELPPPVRKGGRPRIFCSVRCKDKAKRAEFVKPENERRRGT